MEAATPRPWPQSDCGRWGTASPGLTVKCGRAGFAGSAPLEDLPSAHVLLQRAGAARESDGGLSPSRPTANAASAGLAAAPSLASNAGPAAAPSLASTADDDTGSAPVMGAGESGGAPRRGLPHTPTLRTPAPSRRAHTPLADTASILGPGAVPEGAAAERTPVAASAAAAAGLSVLPGTAPGPLPPLQHPVPLAGTDGATTADPPTPLPLLRTPDAAPQQLHDPQRLQVGGWHESSYPLALLASRGASMPTPATPAAPLLGSLSARPPRLDARSPLVASPCTGAAAALCSQDAHAAVRCHEPAGACCFPAVAAAKSAITAAAVARSGGDDEATRPGGDDEATVASPARSDKAFAARPGGADEAAMARHGGSNQAAIALRMAAHAEGRSFEQEGPQTTAEAAATAAAASELSSPIVSSPAASSGFAIGHYKAVYGGGCPVERARRRNPDGSRPTATAAAPGA